MVVFNELCSTPRAQYVWCWGGVGWDNDKRCSCIEEECETLWLLSMNYVARRARDMCGVGVGWGGIITNLVVVFKKNVKHCGWFQEQCSQLGLTTLVIDCKQR